MSKVLSSDLLEITPIRYQKLIKNFLFEMEKQPEFVEKISYYLANKIDDPELAKEIIKMSPETKIDACLENVVIGLISGTLKEKEIKKLLN